MSPIWAVHTPSQVRMTFLVSYMNTVYRSHTSHDLCFSAIFSYLLKNVRLFFGLKVWVQVVMETKKSTAESVKKKIWANPRKPKTDWNFLKTFSFDFRKKRSSIYFSSSWVANSSCPNQKGLLWESNRVLSKCEMSKVGWKNEGTPQVNEKKTHTSQLFAYSAEEQLQRRQNHRKENS